MYETIENLTAEQHAFRRRAVTELLSFIAERSCCSAVVLDGGFDFYRMTYAKLCDKYEETLEKQVPAELRPTAEQRLYSGNTLY